jgi:heme exporter protein A
MLEVSNLECVRGDRRLFKDVSFSLRAGELLQIHGPNGSGKTSLLRMLCGLVLPAEGNISWQGLSIRDLREEYAQAVAYIGHLPAVKDELSALENLSIASELSGVHLSQDQVFAALRRMGLGGRELLPAKVLSQGQRRRVALARLLVSGATLWILDEPLTALDVAAVKLMQSLIEAHLHNGGMVILTTHQDIEIPGFVTQRVDLAA